MKRYIIILYVLLIVPIVSCTDYLDVNKNVDTPDWVEPYLRLGPVLGSYEGIAWDMRVIGPLCQYMGISSSTYNSFALHGFISGNDAGGEAWRMVYWLQGYNLENIINDGLAKEQYTLVGIGYAIKAYSWHLLANVNGDAPLHDAFVPDLQTHRYDSQEEIYKSVRKWAYLAIKYLDMADNTTYGSNLTTYDVVYKGNKSQWKKFAYAVLARHYLCYSNKSDFLSGKNYADSVIFCADNSFSSAQDDAKILNQGETSSNANFYGVLRANLANTYVQSDYAVQVITGTIPAYNSSGTKTGNRVPQITSDASNFDPRACLLLGTTTTGVPVTAFTYIGAKPGSGSNNSAANYFGRTDTPNKDNSGKGRWLYRDDAPYPLTTYAEIQFCKAEAAFLKGNQALAFTAFKNGVSGHMDFCKSYISQVGVGGDKISVADFTTLANAYLSSPYVNGLSSTDFSLSHIMMQKWIALYPWSQETWTDMRRYNYDLVPGTDGKTPEAGTSYTRTIAFHKADAATDRIYKGFYLPSADVADRRMTLATTNAGAPCYRLRPRYNSEYMWNVPSLQKLTPIAGTAENYQTSVMWFSKPGN